MCDEVIIENGRMLGFIPDYYKNQKTCDKAVDNYSLALNLSPIAIRLNKCVRNLSVLILLQYNLFLNATSLEKCVINLLILVILYLILFLIDI